MKFKEQIVDCFIYILQLKTGEMHADVFHHENGYSGEPWNLTNELVQQSKISHYFKVYLKPKPSTTI